MEQFTKQELAKYNGLNGQPAYVAYEGKVYDVTSVFDYGDHQGQHAGKDLTESFKAMSPHSENIYDKYPQVGTLSQ